jgi:hypothetical protein
MYRAMPQGQMTIVRQYHAELHEQARVERAGREARSTRVTQAAAHARTATVAAPAAHVGLLARVGALVHSSPKAAKPIAG